MQRETDSNPYEFVGKCLIAMPGMQDSRFHRSIILICSHSKQGSMGFVLNHPVEKPTFKDILDELNILNDPIVKRDRVDIQEVFRGGPVEQGRGFVIHSLDYGSSNTSRVGSLCGVSGTIDALKRIASSNPPARSVMVLGYAGWSAGQLEKEIAENGWLTVDATPTLVFDTMPANKYEEALAMLGISESMLSSISGHA